MEKLKLYTMRIQEYIMEVMPKYDRLLHFGVGFFIFTTSTLLLSYTKSLIILIAIGIIKELIDKYIKKSKFDVIDLLFTILSGLILTILKIIEYNGL